MGGFIGGAAGAIDSGLALMLLDPKSFNLTDRLLHTLVTVLVLGVLVGLKTAFAYLSKAPLPDEVFEYSP